MRLGRSVRVLLALASVATVAAVPGRLAARDTGSEHAAPTIPKRLWVDARVVWIYSAPRRTPNGLGYFRAGSSIELRDDKPQRGPGCAGQWYGVVPFGYVCADQRTSVRPTRYTASMSSVLAKPRALPFSYALSNHAPMYRRLPTPDEWQASERWLGKAGTHGKLSWGNRGHEKLAEVRDIEPNSEVPSFLADGGSVARAKPKGVLRRMIPLGSMLAYHHSFEHEGRTWLLSADGTVVPADRVRPFRESRFRGVHLGKQAQLPLAWIRGQPRAQYVLDEGRFTATGSSFAVRSSVRLDPSAAARSADGQSYLATLERDREGRTLFVRAGDATVEQPLDKLPWGIAADERWIRFSITRGVLTAFVGKQAVFTTLASPGAGGVPMKGRDPVKWSTTPIGRYRVTFKHLAADMSPEKGEDRKFWIADVPYTQYFNAPFAIHVAYWHEDFGEPMSAGCVNVSPEDGKWLFGWTDPQLPRGWNGVGPGPESGKGTPVIVVR